jgi:hypothetical protein
MKKSRKAKGGPVVYSGAGSNVIDEAMQKRRGGKVTKEVEKPAGEKPRRRMDKRPRKASGGMVGADRMPLSSAATPVGQKDSIVGRRHGRYLEAQDEA